jgi:hypothetical protein
MSTPPLTPIEAKAADLLSMPGVTRKDAETWFVCQMPKVSREVWMAALDKAQSIAPPKNGHSTPEELRQAEAVAANAAKPEDKQGAEQNTAETQTADRAPEMPSEGQSANAEAVEPPPTEPAYALGCSEECRLYGPCEECQKKLFGELPKSSELPEGADAYVFAVLEGMDEFEDFTKREVKKSVLRQVHAKFEGESRQYEEFPYDDKIVALIRNFTKPTKVKAEPKKSAEPVSTPAQPKTFEQVAAETEAQRLQEAARVNQIVSNAVAAARFDEIAPRKQNDFHYDGLLVAGHLIVWVAPTKAEKSLHCLRKAMCDACGAAWLNCRNLKGPVKVFYLDTENSESDFGERWDEIITEFMPGQQRLIKSNLQVTLGKKLREENDIDIEYTNTNLWNHLQEKFQDAGAVYLDCWYDLHSAKASDGVTQKQALREVQKRFKGKTLTIVQHVGRESSESLSKKNAPTLRALGAERWIQRISQSFELAKVAQTFICQEKHMEEPAEGEGLDAGGEVVDMVVWGRSIPTLPLLSWEPVFDDGEREFKYRRRLVTSVSGAAATILAKLKGKGPWTSWHVLRKTEGLMGGKQNVALTELRLKGYLKFEGDLIVVELALGAEALVLKAAYLDPGMLEKAKAFLYRVLTKQGIPNLGVKESVLREVARADGIVLGPSQIYHVTASSADVYDREKEVWVRDNLWVAKTSGTDAAVVLRDEILRAIGNDPNISRDVLFKKMKDEWFQSRRDVTTMLKTLGLEKKQKHPWTRDGKAVAATTDLPSKPDCGVEPETVGVGG